MHAFLQLPTWAIIAASIAVFVVPAAIVAQLVISGRYRAVDDDNSVIGPASAFMGTAFTFLLAFVIVNVWSSVGAREAALYEEFATVNSIVVEVAAVDPPAKSEFVTTLDAYLRAVITSEIENAPPVGGSPQANEAFTSVLQLVDREESALAANPTKSGETGGLFSEAQNLVDAREKRVSTSAPEIGDVFTIVIVVLGMLTVLSVAILPCGSSRKSKWIQTLSVALATGLLLSLAFYVSSAAFIRNAEAAQIDRITAQFEGHSGQAH